ncbi:MAG: hypothetical protein ABGY32_11120 [bacterium]
MTLAGSFQVPRAGPYWHSAEAEGRNGLWWTSQVTLLAAEHLTLTAVPSSVKNP